MPTAIEIRGLAVRTLSQFVSARFPERYAEWLSRLPERSQAIIENANDNDWYDLEDGFSTPTALVCELFFGGSPDGAREIGRYGADQAFTGMFKVFTSMGTPLFTVSRVCKFFEGYLRPVRLEILSQSETSAAARLSELGDYDQYLELRIVGWIERALELHGCSGINVVMRCSTADGERFSEIGVSWHLATQTATEA